MASDNQRPEVRLQSLEKRMVQTVHQRADSAAAVEDKHSRLDRLLDEWSKVHQEQAS
jgi:hypothetical protein